MPEQNSSVFNVRTEVVGDNNIKALHNGQNNKNIVTYNDHNLNINVKQEEIKEKITEQKEEPEGDPVLCNKKCKKYIRRITKLKLLYKEINKEKEETSKNKIDKIKDYFIL